MKNKRFHAAIISLLLHILFAAIIALFISDHYLASDNKAIDVKFVKPEPVRNTVRRSHRTVVLPTTRQTTQHTTKAIQFHIPKADHLSKTENLIQHPTSSQEYATDVFDPTEVSISNPQLEKNRRSITTTPRTPTAVATIPTAETNKKDTTYPCYQSETEHNYHRNI